jgi:DNA-binding NtrC family response regulator
MLPAALIVDPDSRFLPALSSAATRAGWQPIVQTSFAGARRELEKKRPRAVVTNARLGMFNGVQLAYLAKLKRPSSLAIVYSDGADPALGRQAQEAHAFFERVDFVSFALASYLRAELPDKDRRSVWTMDRRKIQRGGRRATDQAALRLSVSAI